MISTKKWKKLQTLWKGKIYSRPNERVIQRLKWFDKVASLLEDKRVLEIGCNSGLMAIKANKYVHSYVGLERKINYYKQAIITKKECRLTKCRFIYGDFRDYKPATFAFDAVILSRVLYHLWDDELELLRKVLKRCQLAMVVCGKKGKGRTHNSYNFAKESEVKEFFRYNNMIFTKNKDHTRFFAGVAFKHVDKS